MEVVQEGNPKPQPSKTLSDFQDKVEDEYKMRIPMNAKPFLQPLNIQHKIGVNGKVILSIPTVEDVCSYFGNTKSILPFNENILN